MAPVPAHQRWPLNDSEPRPRIEPRSYIPDVRDRLAAVRQCSRPSNQFGFSSLYTAPCPPVSALDRRLGCFAGCFYRRRSVHRRCLGARRARAPWGAASARGERGPVSASSERTHDECELLRSKARFRSSTRWLRLFDVSQGFTKAPVVNRFDFESPIASDLERW
jgi:hypothetical protein